MKWLILQSAGEHPENAHLRECFSWQAALRGLGHEADVAGPGNDLDPDYDSYDIILFAEQYDFDMGPLWNWLSCKKIQWIVDLHVHSGYGKIARDMDTVLHATRSLMPNYAADFPNLQHIWFPNAIDERYFNPGPNEYHIGVNRLKSEELKWCDFRFIGSRSAARAQILEALEHRCGLHVSQCLGEEMINAIRCCKIHFNKNIGPDLNYRNFEVAACGTCLLTDRHPDMAELGFVDGVNCLLYDDVDEAEQKCKSALADGSWREIGAAGAKLVLNNHTYTHRIRNLLKQIAL